MRRVKTETSLEPLFASALNQELWAEFFCAVENWLRTLDYKGAKVDDYDNDDDEMLNNIKKLECRPRNDRFVENTYNPG